MFMIRLALTFISCCFALQLDSPVALGQQEGVVYAFDILDRENFLRFPASDPTSLEFVDKNRSPFAMDFEASGETLFAIDSLTYDLGTISQTTGSFTEMVTISGDFQPSMTPGGLSCDETDGTFFLSSSTELFTLDIETGIATSVGEFTSTNGSPPVGLIIDIAIDPLGNMFAHEIDPDPSDGIPQGGLWSVDKSNAACTFIGSSGIESRFAQGMDFDPNTGILYAAITDGDFNGHYGIWDTGTGDYDIIATGTWFLEMAISNGITFAYNVGSVPRELIGFSVNNPFIFDSVDIPFYETFATDFAADGTTLIMFDNFFNTIGTVDTETGCYTPVTALSGLGDFLGGISVDPTSGLIYAVDDQGESGSRLMILPFGPANAEPMVIAEIGTKIGPLPLIIDIAFDNDGNLFGYTIAFDALVTIEKTTGLAELVAITDVGDASFAQGMDFDPVTNILYQAIYVGGGTGVYGSWDLEAGVFNEILPLEAFENPTRIGYELEVAIGLPPIPGDINCDGVLDLLDVEPFVDLLTSGEFLAKADFNNDGEITLLDVSLFVAALSK